MPGRRRRTPWSRLTSQRKGVHFARAVPRWKDRAELRRAFRVAVREIARDQKRETTALLQALVSSHVPVGTVRCSSTGPTILEFRDGTVLELVVREGEARLQRLGRRVVVTYLESVEPCFGRLWFRLTFLSMFDRACVMAQVRARTGASAPGWTRGHGEEAGSAQG